MRWLPLLLLAALALAAVPAQAGHNGAPVPDGVIVVQVLFVTVVNYMPAPTSHFDDLWFQLCGATTGQPVSCTYYGRDCLPNDLAILCQT